jgi:photosystem II stability/assembly factor-like uncharacterized protein
MTIFLVLFFTLAGAGGVAQTGMGGGAPCWIQDATAVQGNVWLLCDRGQVLHSGDQGATWTAAKVQGELAMRSIRFLDQQRGVIAGDGGTVLRSEDGGSTWQTVTVPAKEDLRSVHFVGDLGWIAGYGGTILHSSDGGKTWTRQATGMTLALDGVFFVDETHGWAAGWSGMILRTTTGGTSWEQIHSPAAQWSLNAICFTDRNNGWVAGFLGQLLRTKDGGVTWESRQTPVSAWFRSVFFDSSGRGWITAENDLLVSDDKGETWRAHPLEGRVFLHRVLPVGDSLWAIGPFGVRTRDAKTGKWQMLPVTLAAKGS